MEINQMNAYNVLKIKVQHTQKHSVCVKSLISIVFIQEISGALAALAANINLAC